MEKSPPDLAHVRELSPRRNTTRAASIPELVDEQLRHFSIDPASAFGQRMAEFTTHLYAGNTAAHRLWEVTLRELGDLDAQDRVARFNAKRFLCFQLAKILDTLQNPLRKSYQSLLHDSTQSAVKGPYPIFDNVTALFSATPVITRTATYMYACTEWVEDAFKGREPLHEIYSRLLNPTSISLANHIVDLEAGPLAGEYLAWNFNSGMAAIDATLANLVGYNDIVLSSRNVYGGTYQLLHDWYGKKSNLDVAVEWFDGFTVEDFSAALQATLARHRDRLDRGRRVYVLLESPCNPHGYVLDVPAICRAAHETGPHGDLRCHRRHADPATRAAAQGPDGAAGLRDPLLHQGPRRHRHDHRGRLHRPQRAHVHPQGRHRQRDHAGRTAASSIAGTRACSGTSTT